MKTRRLLLPIGGATILLVALFAVGSVLADVIDLITNGEFVTLADWTTDGAYWTSDCHAGGSCVELNNAEYASQSPVVTTTGLYSWTFWMYPHVTGYDAGIYQILRDGTQGWEEIHSVAQSVSDGGSWTQKEFSVALGPGGWTFQHESTGYPRRNLVDDVEVLYIRDLVPAVEDNLVPNGDFGGGAQDWNDAEEDGNLRGQYMATMGNGEYGFYLLKSGYWLQSDYFTVTEGAVYTYGLAVHHFGAPDPYVTMAIYDTYGVVDSMVCTTSETDWVECADSFYLDPTVYWIRLTPTVDMSVDDVFVSSGAGGEEEEESWGINAWLYYPYTYEDGWGVFQTYSDTTWYGDAYANYNVWYLRPGSYAYPIATLDIMTVGINSFGYYIDSRINVWPDVPSTTVRYEGLQSVTVAPGQRVGPNCELGLVAPNQHLGGVYHLLLYTEFDDVPINPEPYMSKYPQAGMCVPVDPTTGETVGPGAGEIPGQILEVCQECSVPITWTNFGRWIAWLECMIQNLFMCHLIVWLNGIINVQIIAVQQAMETGNAMMGRFNDVVGVQVMHLGRVVAMGPWAAEPVSNGLSWLDALASEAIDYTQAVLWDIDSRMDNLGYIIMSFAGGQVTYVYNEAGTNYWDVLVGIIGLMSNMVNLFTTLISGVFDMLVMIIDLLIGFTNLMAMLFSALITGLTSGSDADLIVGTLNLSELSCTQSGAFAIAGQTQEKAVCFFLVGIGLMNGIMLDSALQYLPTLMVGILSLALLLWIISQFREILPG